MFEGNNALKRIHILSGGEKSRVILGKIIAFPTNLLILDEPTNHLDLESSDALLAALDNFAGTVILVTHNEMFLHALSERLIIFQGDEVRVHEGNYQSFLEKIGWQEEAEKVYESKKEYNNLKTFDKRELRKKRSELYTERSKILKPLEKKINEFELAIETEEAELNKMNNEIIEVTKTKESARIVELSKNIHSSKTKLDFLLNELEEVFTRYEKQKSIIEEKLKELGVV
jgi:ATP-binding cassette subfamily F protein 3